MHDEAERVLIIGAGNLLLGDEGLGVHVARALASRREELPAFVEVIDAGTSLFDVATRITACSRLILVDAIRAGGVPGAIYRIDDASDLGEPGARHVPVSLHDWTATDMLASLRLIGFDPPRLSLVGAEPARIAPGTELSPELARAAERIVSLLIGELRAGPSSRYEQDRPA